MVIPKARNRGNIEVSRLTILQIDGPSVRLCLIAELKKRVHQWTWSDGVAGHNLSEL
jgi:hypothetical protein